MIKATNRTILLMFVFFVFVLQSQSYAQSKEEELTRMMTEENVPGAQIMHIKNGKTSSYHLGEKKYKTGDKVTANTLFQAASMTKVVAAYAMLKLLDQGLFELDKPIADYWEYGRLKDDPYVGEITVRMVLNHTSGLPNWAKDKPLRAGFKPGTDYRYSGEGFYYLQQMLEHLTGKSFQEIVQEEVFIPFGMKASSLLYSDDKDELYAFGHDGEDGLVPSKMRKFRSANAAYTLLTTASDYTRFVQKGLIEGEGLKPETLHAMFTTSSKMKPKNNEQSIEAHKHLSFGLGVLLQENELGKQVIHTGSNGGRYLAIFIAYPKSKESLVILTNGANGNKYREKVAKLLLDEQTFWSFRR